MPLLWTLLLFSTSLFAPDLTFEVRCGLVTNSLAVGQMLSQPGRDFAPLIPQNLRKKERAKWMIEEINDPKSAFGRYCDDYFLAAGADTFFGFHESYELLAFSPSYQSVAKKIDAALPAQGRILDIGSGPGAVSMMLAMGDRERTMVLLDGTAGTKRARQNLRQMPPQHEVHEYLVSRVAGPIPGPPADAAFISHALYLMVRESRLRCLNLTTDALKPGSILVVHEPVREGMGQPGAKQEWMTELILSGLDQGAPYGDYQIALIAMAISGRLVGTTRDHDLLTTSQYEELFKSVPRLKIIRSEPTYDGRSKMWVLKVS